ncbi:deoxynucleotidyltransferase terminal-interacting protein 2 [Leptopilina heterotoma]|uniref:deoxynucleotidyltransferase terminal-interacting protein 2 n=1 Tax=Leptopilina heterotoma TaxID=63436 RepID=UPI001CA89E02|nr:deoxynucleotidyltransferase terminal-interacting protein 2 [Leptopilina heterotoma]
MDIIIDTKGQEDLREKSKLVESDDDLDFDGVDFDPSKIKLQVQKTKKEKINPTKDFDLEEFERDMGWTNERRKQPANVTNTEKMLQEIDPIKKILKKSSIKPGFEKLKKIPGYDVSDKKLKERRKRQRDKTKGKQWFNLPAPEMTEEVKRDLEIIQMRSALDPKQFYKRNDMKTLPKYFQIGKVVDSPLDYYSGRMTNKERKRTIVDELMADAEFAKYNKRKYKEIIEEKNKRNYKAHRHAKRLKSKKR